MHCVQPIFKGVMLNITDDCNLNCKYCFVNKSPHYMSFDIAKDTLDLLIDINKEKGEIPSITFFGGEPTLCWDSIIVPLVEYAKSINEQVEFNITTNGILLNEERLKYMQDNNMILLLSIDGVKECQDYNRPFKNGDGSSFDILEPKLVDIIKYRPNTTFRSTLFPPTCHTLFDNLKFAESKGFKYLFAVPDEGSSWSENDKNILKEQLNNYVEYFIKTFKETGEEPIEFSPVLDMFKNINLYRQNIDTGADYSKCVFPCCGLGIDFASVNYEGKIFACQELPTNSTATNKYFIGDIYNGIDADRHDKLLNEYKDLKLSCVNAEMCKDCQLKPVCTNMVCHANSYIYNKDMSKKTEIKCFWDNLLFEGALKIINELQKNDNFIKFYLKRILNG